MYRFTVAVCFACVALTFETFAATRADSVLTFTGATRAKFVWHRTGNGTNGADTYTGYDTRDNSEQIIKQFTASEMIHWPRIDRAGKWVVWDDPRVPCSYVRDFAATTPIRTLIDGKTNSMWYAVTFQYDTAAKVEYVYCANHYDSSTYAGDSLIYKIPFSIADGTVDLTKKIAINFGQPVQVSQSGRQELGISSVSSDGKKIATSYPWPTDLIFDVPSRTFVWRHNETSVFGCQPNIAPDNSYRFYHCMDDHEGIWMFDANMSTTHWGMDLRLGLVGVASTADPVDAFGEPRWSNHVQFLSNTWRGRSVYLQKFAADFRTTTSSIYISKDTRYADDSPDSWLDNGVIAPDASSGITIQARPQHVKAATGSSSLVVSVKQSRGISNLVISDSRGRILNPHGSWAGTPVRASGVLVAKGSSGK